MNTVVSSAASQKSAPTPRRLSLKVRGVAAALALSMPCLSLPAFAQANAISTGYLTGTWMDNAQCRGHEAMVFFPNQTMSSAGSIPVSYAVTGPSQFTMHGPGGAATIQAQYLNPNQMLVTLNNNSSVFHRCGAQNVQAGGNAQPTPAFLVGGWSHNGNCAMPEVFHNDGRFQTSLNAWGTWTLFGNVLRMMPANGANADLVVQVTGPRNMMLTQGNGQVSYYARCF